MTYRHRHLAKLLILRTAKSISDRLLGTRLSRVRPGRRPRWGRLAISLNRNCVQAWPVLGPEVSRLSHGEAGYGRGLVLKRLEDCIQLGDIQKIVHTLGEVQ